MRNDEDDARVRPKPPRHTVGEPLDTFSVEELEARIALLREEIGRLEAAVAGKQASRSAADAMFKR